MPARPELRPRWLQPLLLVAAWFALGPAGLAADPAPAAEPDDTRAYRILERWIKAIGGRDEIVDLKTLDAECTISFGPGQVPVKFHVRAVARGPYRFDYELAVYGQLTQAFDGQVAWQQNSTLGFGFISPRDHQVNLITTNFRSPLTSVNALPERKVLPDETVAGKKLQVLEMRSPSGQVEKWYFDPATGYRVRLEVPRGGDRLVIEFDDFRRVLGAGVIEPYHLTRREGNRLTVITSQVVLYNEPMDPGLFTAPRGPTEDNREVERILFYNAQGRGEAALAQVQTRVTEETVDVTTSGLRMSTKVYNKRPNLFVTVQQVPGMGPVWEGYDGTTGWAWSEVEGYRTMEGAELQRVAGHADLEGPLKLRAQCPLRRLIGDKTVNGRRLIGIALASASGPAGNFYFDEKTFELAEVETVLQAGATGQLKVVAEFADYRNVDGVLVPFLTTVSNPAMRSVVTVQSVQHNVPVDDEIFKPKKE